MFLKFELTDLFVCLFLIVVFFNVQTRLQPFPQIYCCFDVVLFLPSLLCLCSLSRKGRIITKSFTFAHISQESESSGTYLMTITQVTPASTAVQFLIDLNNDKASHHDRVEDGPTSENKKISIHVWSAVQQISTGWATCSDWLFGIYTHISASLLVAVL